MPTNADGTMGHLQNADLFYLTGIHQEETLLLLAPQAADMNALPQILKRDWVTPDGRARVQVFVKGDGNDKVTLQNFATAVRAIAPDAIGAPSAADPSWSETLAPACARAASAGDTVSMASSAAGSTRPFSTSRDSSALTRSAVSDGTSWP